MKQTKAILEEELQRIYSEHSAATRELQSAQNKVVRLEGAFEALQGVYQRIVDSIKSENNVPDSDNTDSQKQV